MRYHDYFYHPHFEPRPEALQMVRLRLDLLVGLQDSREVCRVNGKVDAVTGIARTVEVLN